MTLDLTRARHLVTAARRVVVLSGAGLSAASGIPTFRDVRTGLWARFNPAQLATAQAFRRDPALVWTWYVWRAVVVHSVLPNTGHEAIGRWQQQLAAAGGELTVATQNVDDLHERAGATGVVHLHGSLQAYRCIDCEQPAAFDPVGTGILPTQEFSEDTLLAPVACVRCASGMLRPGVVWFGESLPEDAFESAVAALQRAELVVVVGSSGLIQPATSLPLIGAEAGATLLEINPVRTPLADRADIYLAATAAEALPQLVGGLA